MPLPDPFPGLVLHYSYLWHDQPRRGLEERSKDRPRVVVLAVSREDGNTLVTVAQRRDCRLGAVGKLRATPRG